MLEQWVQELNRFLEMDEEPPVYRTKSGIEKRRNSVTGILHGNKNTLTGIVAEGSFEGPESYFIGNRSDSGSYMDVFERDIVEAEKQIIVSSPELTRDKVERFLYLVKARQEAGCKVTVITVNPQCVFYGSPEFCHELVCEMQQSGIHVMEREDVAEHFAVIDDDLVWHGGMNLLGREDAWDNLMRIKSFSVAAELLEIALKLENVEV